jgi:transcription elongation GreA/GreB family factor
VSKAFTKEDDDAGIEPVSTTRGLPATPFRLTREGARKLATAGDERSREALARAEIIDTGDAPDRAAIGVSVRVCDEQGATHVYRLVSAEEQVLVGDGCSVVSPIGRALLGAVPGDVREVNVPRGAVELTVVALLGDGGT